MARSKMTEEDKVARRAVREYLEALEASKPKRGRRRTPESIQTRIAGIETARESASPLKRLDLAQERIDLHRELEALGAETDMDALEGNFVEHAKRYGDAKGLTAAAWRAVGVSAATLKRAGI